MNVIRVAWRGPIKFRLATAPKLFPSASYLLSTESGWKDNSIGAEMWYLSGAHKSKSGSFKESLFYIFFIFPFRLTLPT